MFENQIIRAYAANRQAAEKKRDLYIHRIFHANPNLKQLMTELQRARLAVLQATLNGKADAMGACKQKLFYIENLWQTELAAAGVPADFMSPQYTCQLCHDTGHSLKQPAELCHCYQAMRVAQSSLPEEETVIAAAELSEFDWALVGESLTAAGLNSVNMPEIASTASGNKDYTSQPIAIAYAWITQLAQGWSNPGFKNLLLAGQTGTGKTFLAGCAVHAIRRSGRVTIFVSAERILSDFNELRLLRQAFSPDQQRLAELRELTDAYLQCDFLVLDDLGTEAAAAPQAVVTLLKLLNERRPPRCRTMVTSNLTLEQLQSAYDERVTSRLRNNFLYLHLIGADMRDLVRKRQF